VIFKRGDDEFYHSDVGFIRSLTFYATFFLSSSSCTCIYSRHVMGGIWCGSGAACLDNNGKHMLVFVNSRTVTL